MTAIQTLETTFTKLIVLVLDNGGFAVINKLQNNTGNESFNNLFADCPTVGQAFAVDFAAHAASMGANAESVANPAELGEAFKRAKASDKTSVIVMQVDAYEGWTTEGHAWWEVGTPEGSNSAKVLEKHAEIEATRPLHRGKRPQRRDEARHALGITFENAPEE